VQSALASGGYPAPRPLVAPTPCGSGHVTAEELLQLSSRPDGHDPAVRRELARGLVQFVQRARPFAAAFADVPYVFDVPAGGVYAVPQSTRFDFDATTAGAEWIDALAEEARARLRDDSGERVVVHGEWRIENVGFRDGRFAAVFDWDSVHVAREVEAVATAATTFCVDWRRPPGNSFPRPSEIAAFLHDYETARGAAFSADECHLLAAAMVASLAYGARCEHADRSRPVERDSQRGLLQELGALLLDEGLAVLGF